MKLSPRIPAKALLLLFLGIALTSGYLAMGLNTELTDSRATLGSVNKSMAQAQTTHAAVDRALVPVDPDAVDPGSLADRVSIFNTQVQASRINHRVNIASVLSGSDVMAAADTLAGTRVQSVRLVYRGTYASYTGLLDWLSGIRELGGAIASLRVKGTEFEVAVRLYGMERENQ